MAKSDMPIHHVEVNDVRTELPELLHRIQAGEEFVICRDARPIARLVPFRNHPRRQFGIDRDVAAVPHDFDAPLPPDILDSFE